MEFEVALSGMAYGGEAVGRLPDGRLVFVPYALPGEHVLLRLEKEKRGYARARLLEVIKSASERIAPRCRHFGECGGCHYQHMPYSLQLAVKSDVLQEQLERIGGLGDVPISQPVPSPNIFNYRNYLQFHLTPQGALGFHLTNLGDISGRGDVFSIQECHLPEEAINSVWPNLRIEDTAGLERIGFRQGSGEDIQLILEGSNIFPPPVTVEGLPISAVHLGPGGLLVLAGSETVTMEVLERSFRVSAGSFFQVNTAMAGKMATHVLENLAGSYSLDRNSVVVDCYCGVGLFSAFLAPRAGKIIAIESSPSAVEDYVINLDEFDNVDLYEAPVEMVLPSLEVKPGLILVDPPRAGLANRAMDGLLNLAAPLVVYVSCDPATLARDARKLVPGGYRLEQITLFDLFPQTYHIESISWWKRF